MSSMTFFRLLATIHSESLHDRQKGGWTDMYVLMEISAIGKGSQRLPLRIAAARLEPSNLAKRGNFSSFVRPEYLTLINWRTDQYAQSIRASVLDAKPVAQVIEELMNWLAEDDILFCWDDNTLSTYQKLREKYGNPQKEINTIREGVLMHLKDGSRKKGNPLKLCSCRGYEISGSCYDAEKIIKAVIILARKANVNLEQIVKIKEKKTSDKQATKADNVRQPLIYSLSSHRKTVHRSDCFIIQKMVEDKIVYFSDMRNARLAGYHPCFYCSPIRKMYRKEENKLKNYARPHELVVEYHDDTVYVQSRFDFWRVIYDDVTQKLLLMHKNTKATKLQSSPSLLPGFHEQKCEATTLRGTLRTIAEHDVYRERQNMKESLLKQKPKEAKKIRKKEHKREIRRTISLIDELKDCGRL